MKKILVIDDEKAVRYSFERAFGEAYEVITADNGLEGVEKAQIERPDIVLIDIKMPVMNGLEAMKRIKKSLPELPIIMMTAFGDTETAIEAMKEGVYDYITKPFENKELRMMISKALSHSKSSQEDVRYHADKEESNRIIGKSSSILKVSKVIGQVANTDVSVLITGESGVGKELVARAIHLHSHRKDKPFIALNCASIPENLVESELFGYEQGAFTGASKRHSGLFEQCNGGTLLLDEIADMNLAAQSKVLRIMQDSTFYRLGGTQTIKADVRIIAATNKDLIEEVRRENFRADLFHRLNVVSIHIPPLRERKEDIPIIAEYFLNRAAKETNRHVKAISPNAIEFLETCYWQGNVRELKNTIYRAVIVAKGSIIDKDDIVLMGTDISQGFNEAIQPYIETMLLSGEAKPFDRIISGIEKLLVMKALELTKGNQVRASSMLGITRVTLRKKIEEFGLSA